MQGIRQERTREWRFNWERHHYALGQGAARRGQCHFFPHPAGMSNCMRQMTNIGEFYCAVPHCHQLEDFLRALAEIYANSCLLKVTMTCMHDDRCWRVHGVEANP